MPKKPQIRFSPGALVLINAGITLQSVGDALGVTRQAVSLQLAGLRSPNPALLPIVRALAGDDVASDLASALTDSGSQS